MKCLLCLRKASYTLYIHIGSLKFSIDPLTLKGCLFAALHFLKCCSATCNTRFPDRITPLVKLHTP